MFFCCCFFSCALECELSECNCSPCFHTDGGDFFVPDTVMEASPSPTIHGVIPLLRLCKTAAKVPDHTLQTCDGCAAFFPHFGEATVPSFLWHPGNMTTSVQRAATDCSCCWWEMRQISQLQFLFCCEGDTAVCRRTLHWTDASSVTTICQKKFTGWVPVHQLDT